MAFLSSVLSKINWSTVVPVAFSIANTAAVAYFACQGTTSVVVIPEEVPSWKNRFSLSSIIPYFEKQVPIRRVAITCCGVYVFWFCYRTGLFSKFFSFLRYMAPGFNYIKFKLTGHPEIRIEIDPTETSTRIIQESIRAGSTESAANPPHFQCMIGYVDSGVFTAVGAAIRIHDVLVMPRHVYDQCMERPAAYGNRTKNIVNLVNFECIDMDTDLIMVKTTKDALATIGMAIPSIQNCIPIAGTNVNIVGIENAGTTGNLQLSEVNFGCTVYHGTTKPGYSGAAYFAGPRLVGMHSHGGPLNGGYSASFILAMVNHFLSKIPEDSDKWLAQQFRAGKEIKFDLGWGSLDTERIQIGGEFHIVQKRSCVSAIGKDYGNHVNDDGYLKFKFDGQYQDYSDEDSSRGRARSRRGRKIKRNRFRSESPINESAIPKNEKSRGSNTSGKSEASADQLINESLRVELMNLISSAIRSSMKRTAYRKSPPTPNTNPSNSTPNTS
ncbi:hypothetical protein 1 [Shuangao sobemo-like virus 3]|uniref:hypothetical protein 1 n=1 Tax=Shuangao sobemo-like virus 3 TaxID=1923476 RepID=UPI00090BC100|nr:hypothetical protein 1 [Shuangao sobemo-like virus 3]APG75742.1 hypothetical protein 1 [Shuangao sobemo-like virus 3]